MNGRDSHKRTAVRTYIGYFGFLAIVLVIVGYASRDVVFRPWTSRTGGAVVAVGDSAYVIGGRGSDHKLYRDILALDFRGGTLKHVGALPTPAIGASAAALAGKVYIAGGWDGTRVTDSIWRFDPSTRSLQPVGHLVGPRAFGGLVAFRGALYYLGGWDGSSAHDGIEGIDPASGRAEPVGRLPQPLQLFAAVSTSDAVYVIGGEDASGRSLDAIDVIDPTNGRMLRAGRLPEPRERGTAVLFGRMIYVTGGLTGQPVAELLAIDTAAPAVSAKVVGFIQRDVTDVGFAEAGGSLYLVGGQEERLRRQIGILRVDPATAQTANVVLASYVWW